MHSVVMKAVQLRVGSEMSSDKVPVNESQRSDARNDDDVCDEISMTKCQ